MGKFFLRRRLGLASKPILLFRARLRDRTRSRQPRVVVVRKRIVRRSALSAARTARGVDRSGDDEGEEEEESEESEQLRVLAGGQTSEDVARRS